MFKNIHSLHCSSKVVTMASIHMGNALCSSLGSCTTLTCLTQRTSKQLLNAKIFAPVAFVKSSSISVDRPTSPKAKTRSKKKQRSTNVIHVGDESVLDKNTKVKLLTASQLHKVDNVSSKSTNPTSLDTKKGVDSQPFYSETNLYSDAMSLDTISLFNSYEETVAEEEFVPLAEVLPRTKISNATKTPLPKISKAKAKELKREKTLKIFEEIRWKGRNQNFNDTLSAFICVCMNTGHGRSAFQTFNFYLRNQDNYSSKYNKVLSITPFNEILKGVSSMGDFEKMKEVLHHLKKSSLKPDFNTFAHIFSCLGRLKPSVECLKEIESTYQAMLKHKINIETLITSASFSKDSLQYCLKALRRVQPDLESLSVFNPSLEVIVSRNSYSNPLVNSLNKDLFSTKVKSFADSVVTPSQMRDLIKKQIEQERRGYAEIPSVLGIDNSDEKKRNAQLFEEWKAHWEKSLRNGLALRKEFMEKNFLQRDSLGLDFYPFFGALDNEDILSILMMEVHKLCMSSGHFSPTLNALASSLGDEFYNRFLIRYKEKTGFMLSLEEVYDKYCAWYLNPSERDCSYVPRVQWNKIVLEGIKNNNLRDRPPVWPYTVKVSIGRVLYSLILSNVVVWEQGKKSKQLSPAFYKIHRTYDLKIRDEIKPSPILLKVFRGAPQKILYFSAATLPMVSPPIPWTSIYSGGYFVSRGDFVRVVPHAQQQTMRMKEGGNRKLFPIMDSLNQLGSVPWKINTEILDLIIEVFREKGWDEMDIIPHPSEIAAPPPITSSLSLQEKKTLKKAHSEYHKKKNEVNSLWCSMLYRLSIANYFRDQTIWLPLNMDFRGRTYPIPPHLTHLSSDIFRSLMMFAQGKKLGEEGLSWLKLHLVNLTGIKKRCSVQERLDFCEEVMDEIEDSAVNPLHGRRWWTESDEPWQTLVTCKELVAALKSESPEDYVCHLPIHQDGSCNGLQHYAALGRDKDGARSVNLSPSVIPQDVYSDVVVLVEEARRRDAENGVEIAKVLEGFVKRKVIKQTVMTTVYGVTRFGAKLQILKQLNYMSDFPEKQRFRAAVYLASKTFECLGTIFSATEEIQDWLVKVADGISRHCEENVEWVTPLGFPVVQPYSKNINMSVIPGKIYPSHNCDYFLTPNFRKQRNGFPPNFIHSLDSSHMMLTSIFCQHAGITFVSIHDCFWTHPSSVAIMNKICRQQFVTLHSQPILEDMAKFMVSKYSSHINYTTSFTTTGKEEKRLASLENILSNVPQKGTFDIEEVLKSVFFFS